MLLAATGFLCAAECGAREQPELELELIGCIDAKQPWMTCAEFCEWDGAVCAEQACGGRTTRAYETLDDCAHDRDPIEQEFGCEEQLQIHELPGGLSYYDCCCDYR
ncbi:MAG TPA: hypothetical protein VK034_00580 [Enhygromyxa sp.]|nr:hypothetical protein [Enhygromyxa sp.]